MVLIVWILYFSFTCVDRWGSNTWPWARFHNQGFTLSFISLIIADQILNDLLYCSYKYNCYLLNCCLCRSIGQLYILLITFLINFSDICKVLHETFWIKLKTDWGGQIVSCYGLIQIDMCTFICSQLVFSDLSLEGLYEWLTISYYNYSKLKTIPGILSLSPIYRDDTHFLHS